jgi:hypothetical protein
MQFLSFYAWHISLNIPSSRFIHIVTDVEEVVSREHQRTKCYEEDPVV